MTTDGNGVRIALERSSHEKCFRNTKWPDNKTIDPKSLSRGLRWFVFCSIWVIVTVIPLYQLVMSVDGMRQYFRFSLRSLCLLVVVAAIGTTVSHRYYVAHQKRELARSTPLEWLQFNQKSINEKLSSGQPVLVMYYGHWKDRPLRRLDTEEMRLALFDKNIATFSGNSHLITLEEQGIEKARDKVRLPNGEYWFGAVYYPDETVDTFDWIPDSKDFADSAVRTIRSGKRGITK